jgi:hypothetical protein
VRISQQNSAHCRKPSPRAAADAKPLRALLPGREASSDFSGAGPTLTLDGRSREDPLTDAQLHPNCAAIASPPTAVSTTKFTIYVLFTFRPLSLILFTFQPLEFYKNTLVLFHNYILAPVILHLGPQSTFYNYN